MGTLELGQKTYRRLRSGDHKPSSVDVDDVDGRSAEERRLIDDVQGLARLPAREPSEQRSRDGVHDPACESIHDGTSICSDPERPPTVKRTSTAWWGVRAGSELSVKRTMR
jgi:hypothetical protein